MAAGSLTNVPIRRRSSCFSGPLPAAMRKAPISISATWPPEGRLGSCLTNTRPVSGSQASNHLSPLGTAVNLSRPKRPRRNLLPVPPNGRSATPAVKGRRFKLRYYRNLLLPPARPSGSNADALPRVTHCRRGRLNLPTSPALTGSPPILNTIGMGAVADSAATPEGSLRPLR